MAEQVTEKPEAVAPVTEAQDVPAAENKKEEQPVETMKEDEAKTDVEDKTQNEESKNSDTEMTEPPAPVEKQSADGDTEMADATEVSIADQSVSTPAPKSSASRRKSTGGSTRKALNKKQSKAKITNLDAKPGDHFLVKLKGFPEWPVIIADEDMLPEALLTTRPVTAAKPDGSYTESYADGGKRVNDRNYPIMYLSTNEFGWIINTALTELSAEKAAESAKKDKMRKDLKSAFELAAAHHPLDYYKDILRSFEEEMKAAAEAAALAAATPKKSKKGKSKADGEDEDVEMGDGTESVKKAKKRKAEEETSAVPRSDSVKKPKIKLSTVKAANGASAKDSAKAKPKVVKKSGDKKPEIAKMTPEERHARKEKEVLYLRHKLQRGLLTRDQQPQETEMQQMAEYITLLENFSDLEVSIIRATKINKVLKAILKLESIPREEEFKFKARSESLLGKWNKLLAADASPAPAANAATNGVNGKTESGKKDDEKKDGVDKAKSTEPEKTTVEGSPKDTSDKSEKPTEETKAEESKEADTAAESVETAA